MLDTMVWLIGLSAIALWFLGIRLKLKLWHKVLAALVLGVVVGLLWANFTGKEPVLLDNGEVYMVDGEEVTARTFLSANFIWLGELFVQMIRMLVVPLIFTTLVAGVLAMGDPEKLGSIGLKAIGLYMGTTAVAVVIGLTFGTIFTPGLGMEDAVSGAAPRELPPGVGLVDQIKNIIPRNIIEAFSADNVLGVIFFSILLGVGILLAGDAGKPIGNLFNSAAETMQHVTLLIMELAPIGVFALISATVSAKGVDTLTNLLTLSLVVYGGCLTHMFLVQGSLVRLVLNLPFLNFFRGAVDAQLVAYSTSSSSATLPVTMTVAEENLGIKPPVAGSVLPLGATINMDGTALYVGIVTLFAAQAFGIDLTMTDYIIVGLTTILVSIGTAAIPSASLFLLATVLTQIGVSAEQTALVVGLILPFDRILDMMRTTVNVTGDLAVATAVGKWEGEIDEDVFRASNVA